MTLRELAVPLLITALVCRWARRFAAGVETSAWAPAYHQVRAHRI